MRSFLEAVKYVQLFHLVSFKMYTKYLYASLV